jgi:predicted porin
MKKKLLSLAVIALCSSLAHADSVTVYGLVDAGVTRYSNAASTGGGSSPTTRMDTGVANGNRLGFKGEEDLGGNTKAFFTLETGFNVDTGALGQGGLLFGRQAFVGLSNAWGSLSLGRQYDFMVNQNAYSTGGTTVAGLMAFGLHADGAGAGVLNDRIYAGDRVNNSIKYASNPISGITVGAMYGLGEVAGNNSAARSYSARVGYDQGPVSAGLAVTDINDAASVFSTRIYGLGGSYQLGSIRPFVSATQVKNDAVVPSKAENYEIGATWSVRPAVDLSAGYQRQNRNSIDSANQLTLVADYKFSKRTDVYAAAAFLRDKGRHAQTTAGLGLASSDGSQSALRLGLRHRF